MTSTSAVFIPVTTAVFDKHKGMVNNRMSCAGEQIKNKVSGVAQSTALAGSVAGLTYAAHKSDFAAKTVMKGLKLVQGLMNKNKYTGKVASAITKALSGFSRTTKIGAALTLAALPILYVIGQKHTFRAGQIDQEYTDRAAVQGKMNDMVSINSLR